MNKKILLVAHGSRRKKANAFVLELVQKLNFSQNGRKTNVTACFLEMGQPSIQEAFELALRQGYKQIHFLPYFLAPGAHVEKDIPTIVGELKEASQGVEIEMLPPLFEADGFLAYLDQTLTQAMQK